MKIKSKGKQDYLDLSYFDDNLLVTEIDKNLVSSDCSINFGNDLSIYSIASDAEYDNRQQSIHSLKYESKTKTASAFAEIKRMKLEQEEHEKYKGKFLV